MLKRAGIIFLKVCIIGILLGIMFAFSVYLGAFGSLPGKMELLNYKNATASSVFSADGKLIGKFFTENRTNITYEQMPGFLVSALLATEDARFFDHGPVDPRSLFRVLFKTLLFREQSSGGGSTITQQLAKNMYGRRNYSIFTIPVSKIKEIILAFRLEKIFSKQEIVTLYLNTVSFGENIFGIGTASERYFGKETDELKVEESAVLIGMLKANTKYNPRLNPENARIRRNVVIKQMEKYRYLKKPEADSLIKLPLKLKYTNFEAEGVADYFLVQVKNEAERILLNHYSATGRKWDVEKDGLTISTTLNLPLQEFAVKAFSVHLAVMQKKLEDQYNSASGKRAIKEITEKELKRLNLSQRADSATTYDIFRWNGTYTGTINVRDSLMNALTLLHAGLLALDPSTGAVRAWVGGIDFTTQPYDQILARRQLGSVFKPVLYSAALETGMEPCQYLDNDSVVLRGFNDYSPENYDHSYGGKYSLAGALAQSMNVPTFSLFLKIGFPAVDSMWKNLGFSFPIEDAPSLALGTSEASVGEIAIAYSAFANGGYRINPHTILTIKGPDGGIIWESNLIETRKKVLSDKTAILMSAMLQKAVREGTGASLNSVYGVTLPLAGKTGTTQNYADAWFAAFNPKLTIVARVGASTPSVHFNSGSNGSGSTLALPLIGLTLWSLQRDPRLKEALIAPFPDLPPELQGALDCPDFREENMFDILRDVFKRNRNEIIRKVPKPGKARRPLFRRLFRR